MHANEQVQSLEENTFQQDRSARN